MNLMPFTQHTVGVLEKFDCRVKTVILLAAVVVVSTLTHWLLILIVLLIGLALFSLTSKPRNVLLKRLMMPFGIAWLVLLNATLTHGHHVLWQLPAFGYTLNIYSEGLIFGVMLFLRIMAAVIYVSVLAFSTSMVDILQTLRLCKVPGTMIDIAEMMYRYVFILQDTSHTLRQAQVSRLAECSRWHKRVIDAGKIAGSILLRSFERSTRIYQAMLSRGYNEDNPEFHYFTCTIPIKDKYAGIAAGCILVFFLVINILM